MSVPEQHDDDHERGRSLGARYYRPDLYPGGSLQRAGFADFHAAAHLMLRVGMQAAVLEPAVVDLDVFLEGVLEGVSAAHSAHRASTQSHANAPGCDPDAPWGMCEYCEAYAVAMDRSQESRARWLEEADDPSREFVVGGAGSKIHIRGCPAVTRMLSSAEADLESLTPAAARHGSMRARWPRLLTRPEAVAARRHRCDVCCPDLPERPTRGPVKGANGQFTSTP